MFISYCVSTLEINKKPSSIRIVFRDAKRRHYIYGKVIFVIANQRETDQGKTRSARCSPLDRMPSLIKQGKKETARSLFKRLSARNIIPCLRKVLTLFRTEASKNVYTGQGYENTIYCPAAHPRIAPSPTPLCRALAFKVHDRRKHSRTKSRQLHKSSHLMDSILKEFVLRRVWNDMEHPPFCMVFDEFESKKSKTYRRQAY